MRLTRMWRIMQIEEEWITSSDISIHCNSFHHMTAEFNNCYNYSFKLIQLVRIFLVGDIAHPTVLRRFFYQQNCFKLLQAKGSSLSNCINFNPFPICTSPIIHLVCPPSPPPPQKKKSLHNLWFSFHFARCASGVLAPGNFAKKCVLKLAEQFSLSLLCYKELKLTKKQFTGCTLC